MEQKNSIRPLGDIVADLKARIDPKCHCEDSDLQTILEELDKKVEDQKKLDKGLNFFMVIFVVFIFAAVVGCIFLVDRNDALEYRIRRMEYRDSLFTKIMEAEPDSSISYRIHNGQPVTYHQLESKCDSITKMYYELRYENAMQQVRLNAIKAQYPIRIIEKKNSIYAISPKIDSALMLYQVYKDKLKYDETTGHWYIHQ